MNLFLAFLLLFYFISPSLVHIDASVVPTLASRQQTSRFRLVHTNDVHVHYDEFNRFFTDCTDADLNSSYGCYGGAPRLLTAISKLRLEANQSNIPFLVLDAGDQFQGTLFYTYWKQFGMNITATVMNSLGVDTFTLGNHEFDDGTAGLVPMLRLLEAKVLAANMKSTNAELERLVEPYAVIEKAGIKIGVVGVTTPSTPAISSPGPDVEFGEVTSSVQSAIDELKAQDIKCIIVASHIGYNEDISLARSISGAQIIVGGHAHSLLLNNQSASLGDPVSGSYPTIVMDKDGKEVYVVQAFWGGKYLGFLDVEVDPECRVTKISGDPILLDRSITPDPDLDKLVKEWKIPFELLSNQFVANLSTDLFTRDCVNQSCPLGNLVTGCMRNATTVPKGSIALLNRGIFKVDLSAGPVTRGTIISLLPFANSLTTFNYSGGQLLDTLEVTASAPNTTNDWFSPARVVVDAFLQVSGVRFAYHPTKPYGTKVIRAQYQASDGNWSDILPDNSYPIVSIDFLASGGDGLLKPPPALNGAQLISLSKLEEEVVACWNRSGTVEPIIDDRICNLGVEARCSWIETPKPGDAGRVRVSIVWVVAGLVAALVS